MFSKWGWLFLLIGIVQACIILGFECYIFIVFRDELIKQGGDITVQRTIPTFLTLYAFGFVYQLYLVTDALRLKNTIQIIGLVLYNVGLLIYGAVQLDQIRDARQENFHVDIWSQTRGYLIAIPSLLGLATILMGFVAWKLYTEFAWTIYQHISADLRMKRRYLTYQVYIALLKFDFFFFLGFTVQFVVIVPKTDAEFGVTIAAIPVTIAILFAAAWFTKRESLPGTIAILVFYIGGCAYFVFKLVRMYAPSPRLADYKPARKELTTFAVLTILLIILTIINAVMCARNFNKGLKPYIDSSRKRGAEEKSSGDDNYSPYASEMQPGPSGIKNPHVSARMEID